MRKKIQFRAVFGLYALYEKLCEDDKNVALELMGTFLKNEYIFLNKIIYIVNYTLNLLVFLYFKYGYDPFINTFVMSV